MLVVLVIALGWAPAAQGACGDHVRYPGQPSAGQKNNQPGEPMQSPSPCQGPNCSRHEKTPLVPPASAPRIAPSQDLYPILPAAPFAAQRSLDSPRSTVLRALSFSPSAIFHPPR
jgi:hypothetical protein